MNDDLRQLEKILLNMRPSGIIQNQIVDALKSILWLFQKHCECQTKPEVKLGPTIEDIKNKITAIHSTPTKLD